jgi:hypothetical protein
VTDQTPNQVDLTPHQEKYLLYRAVRAQREALVKQEEALKTDFKKLMGDATVALIDGEEVFTFDHTKTFRWREFSEENPILAKQYSKPVLVDEPDLEALKKDHPALYERYRSRQFNTKKVV